jgi:CHAD domain-containing protein
MRNDGSAALLSSRVRRARDAAAPALEGDVDSVHVLRVALRSLRTTLPALLRRSERRRTRGAKKALSAAIRLLGPVRDRDIGRSLLLEIPDGPVVHAQKRRLVRDSERDRRRAMGRCRRRWPANLDRLLRRLERLRGAARGRVTRRSRKLGSRSLRDASRALTRLEDRRSLARFHALRKSLRELRYALDLFVTVAPDAGIDVAELKAFQAALGESQDLVVTARWALRRPADAARRAQAKAWRDRARADLAGLDFRDVRRVLRDLRTALRRGGAA